MSSSLYSDLSHYYDLMCAEIDYQAQSATALRLHQLLGNGQNEYLDVACGTGPHIAYFLQHGYHCMGVDLNPAMLEQAQLRCPNAEFELQDMCSLSLATTYDLATCFLYSVHYSGTRENLQRVFAGVFNSLNSGGLFCFDAVDKTKIANDSGVKHEVVQGDTRIAFQSRWFYPGEGEALQLHIGIAETTVENQRIWQDEHRMVAVTIDEISQLLQEVGFEVTVLERDFEKLIPWQGDSGNVIFAAVKP